MPAKRPAEITVTVTAEQADLIATALKHYANLLDRVEEAAEELDQHGFGGFYDEGEDKRYRSERLNIGIVRRKLSA